MHRHSGLGHKWRKLVREKPTTLVLILAILFVVLFMAAIIVLLTDARFRIRS